MENKNKNICTQKNCIMKKSYNYKDNNELCFFHNFIYKNYELKNICSFYDCMNECYHNLIICLSHKCKEKYCFLPIINDTCYCEKHKNNLLNDYESSNLDYNYKSCDLDDYYKKNKKYIDDTFICGSQNLCSKKNCMESKYIYLSYNAKINFNYVEKISDYCHYHHYNKDKKRFKPTV